VPWRWLRQQQIKTLRSATTTRLAFTLRDATLDVTRLGPDDAGMPRLQKLLGRQVRTPAAALAATLECQR